METLVSSLRAAIQRYPDHRAIIDHERVLSYQGLKNEVQVLETRLVVAGIGQGTRVALVLPNGIEFVSAFFALAQIGGIAVPLNPSLRPPEIACIIQDAQVSWVLTVRELHDRCVSAVLSVPGLRTNSVIVLEEPRFSPLVSDAEHLECSSPPGLARPHDPVLLLYSSGSTGQPKRIERSHFNLIYETQRLIAALQLSPRDRILGVAPFCHVNGLMRSMVAAMLSGATLVPLARFERRAVARTIQEYGITVFIGVPFMFAMLAETRWPQPVDFSSLRLCISSSGPLHPETSLRFYERYGIHVRQLYGTTETGTISVNLSPQIEKSLESVGIPLDGIDVEVFGADRRVLEAELVGEIGIRSLAAVREYPGAADAAHAAFRDGYFFPGDIGRKDEEGRLYLLGRKSLVINRGGYKVNPGEIEGVIERHPKVREVAVVGVDTPYGDQKIKAVIVPNAPCAEYEIVEFCRGKVAEFKIPSIVEFRTELPKSPTGKILRREL